MAAYSLRDGFGSPVEDIPGQNASDERKLSLLPAQLLQRPDSLLVVLERTVVLLLFDLKAHTYTRDRDEMKN